MPSYDYRCGDCGTFTATLSMAAAKAAHACPDCGTQARRVWGAPALHAGNQKLRALQERAEGSADAPQLVHREPARPLDLSSRRFGRSRQSLPRP